MIAQFHRPLAYLLNMWTVKPSRRCNRGNCSIGISTDSSILPVLCPGSTRETSSIEKISFTTRTKPLYALLSSRRKLHRNIPRVWSMHASPSFSFRSRVRGDGIAWISSSDSWWNAIWFDHVWLHLHHSSRSCTCFCTDKGWVPRVVE